MLETIRNNVGTILPCCGCCESSRVTLPLICHLKNLVILETVDNQNDVADNVQELPELHSKSQAAQA